MRNVKFDFVVLPHSERQPNKTIL